MNPTTEGYDRIAATFEEARRPKPWQLPYFETLADSVRTGGRALDCGCGNGHDGLACLIRKGLRVVGLDGSSEMLKLFRKRYPRVPTVHCDMLDYRPAEAFDAIVAWDSAFHLSHDDQRRMIRRFGTWLRPEGRLLFTSGPDHSVAEGEMFGTGFTYASFADEEYRALLAESGFVDVHAAFDEPGGEIHKVWQAKKAAGKTEIGSPRLAAAAIRSLQDGMKAQPAVAPAAAGAMRQISPSSSAST